MFDQQTHNFSLLLYTCWTNIVSNICCNTNEYIFNILWLITHKMINMNSYFFFFLSLTFLFQCSCCCYYCCVVVAHKKKYIVNCEKLLCYVMRNKNPSSFSVAFDGKFVLFSCFPFYWVVKKNMKMIKWWGCLS